MIGDPRVRETQARSVHRGAWAVSRGGCARGAVCQREGSSWSTTDCTGTGQSATYKIQSFRQVDPTTTHRRPLLTWFRHTPRRRRRGGHRARAPDGERREGIHIAIDAVDHGESWRADHGRG